MIINKEAVRKFSIDNLARFSNSQYFNLSPGEEHYRLLSYLSTLISGKMILDIGTYQGYSALALSYNISNHVISIGIEDTELVDISRLPVQNITFKRASWEDCLDLLDKASLILFDTSHDGLQEIEFIKAIGNSNFSGMLIFDDINFNFEMQEFWAGIKDPKLDLTTIGHASGTGLVPVGIEVLLEE